MSNKIYPCLWFDAKAQEAAEFYCSIIPNSKILESTPIATTYELDGSRYMNINGGSAFQFNESISIVVTCENQDEVDFYWEKLMLGGKESMCGWLKDKYGVSWQVVPSVLGELMSVQIKHQK